MNNVDLEAAKQSSLEDRVPFLELTGLLEVSGYGGHRTYRGQCIDLGSHRTCRGQCLDLGGHRTYRGQ